MKNHNQLVTTKVLKKVRPIVDQYWHELPEDQKAVWLKYEAYRTEHDEYQNPGLVERWAEEQVKEIHKKRDKEERLEANRKREEQRQHELTQAEAVGIAVAAAMAKLREEQ